MLFLRVACVCVGVCFSVVRVVRVVSFACCALWLVCVCFVLFVVCCRVCVCFVLFVVCCRVLCVVRVVCCVFCVVRSAF